MFGFLRGSKLIKDDLKGIAKLIYEDVSDNAWDKENLTKRNLDFTVDSVRYIDIYVKKLMNTEIGTSLLHVHFENFVERIGAYIGEVIKNNIRHDFNWYEFNSVNNYSYQLDGKYKSIQPYTLLYSKERDATIFPLHVVSQFLKNDPSYPNLLVYVEEMIKQNS
jgi:hypothetical protein